MPKTDVDLIEFAGDLARLTPRERQILLHLVKGHTVAKVADELGVKRETVKTQVARIYRKFDVRTRTELIKRVMSREMPSFVTLP